MPSLISPINTITYISPYATMQPPISVAGITVQTIQSQSPSPAGVLNPVLVIRLRTATSGIVIGISALTGSNAGSVKQATLQPSFPLSATESYMVDLIWVPKTTPPANIDWDSAVTSAPVIASEVTIEKASFDGNIVTAQLSYGTSGVGVGAQVTVWSLSGTSLVYIGTGTTQSNTATVTVNAAGYPSVFFISAQAAIPVSNSGAGFFSAPFSLGPQTVIVDSTGTPKYFGIPTAAASLTTASYDSKNIYISWALLSPSNSVSPDSSVIQIYSGTELIGTFKGGATSAIIPIDVNGRANISVKIATSLANISSAPLPFNLITQVPTITNVIAISSTQVTATVTPAVAGLPSKAWLMQGSKLIAGPVVTAGNIATFNYNAIGMVGLSVEASITSADGKITGPKNAPAALLATAPTITNANIYTNPTNAQQWIVDINWNNLLDNALNIVSYTASVFQGTTSVMSQTITGNGTRVSLTFAKTAITLSSQQSIQLYATGISGGNSPTQTISAIFTAPNLVSLNTNASQIDVVWAAATVLSTNTFPITYQTIVKAASATIFKGKQTSATQSSIPLSEVVVPTSGIITVMVNVSLGVVNLITDASMGLSTNANPILQAPFIKLSSTNPLTNASTINWNSVSGATAYTISFSDNTTQSSPTASYLLTQVLTPSSSLFYSVRGTGTSNGIALTGPKSILTSVVVNNTTITKLRFNGNSVDMSWVIVPDALSYIVTVYDNTPIQISTNTYYTNSASFSITPAVGKTYVAYVQPVMTNGTGLRVSSMPLFEPGIFISKQLITTAYPYLYNAQTMAMLGTATTNPTGQPIVLYLPELGATNGALGSTPIIKDPFTIEPSNNTTLPYKLTIAAGDTAWKFGTDAIRNLLQQNYVTFLKNIELPPAGSLAGATPYGISLVQATIARSLPQTFAELLYYNFGFSTVSTVGSGYIDLRPGMILRVSTSNYINTAQSNTPSWVNGYAGASVLDFEMGSYTSGTKWLTGFDSFLNALVSQGALSVPTPANSSANVQAGVAGSVDLYYTQFMQPFYRLYFPSGINASWGNGTNTTSTNFTLVAAPTYNALQNTSIDPTSNPTAYFRGRTMVEVMIKIMVNNAERLVPVGTSIGNLLEQLNMRPSVTSPLFKKLRVYRSIVSVTDNVQPSLSSGPYTELRLDWNGLSIYSTGNGLDGMSVSLLPGDQIFT